MSDFNHKEKAVAALLSNSPLLKNAIKKSYQYFNFIFNKKNYLFKSKHEILEVDDTNQSSFFGYYDKSPENFSGNKVIYHRTKYDTKKLPSKSLSVQIVLKCLKTNNIEVVDQTYAYNWQQGSKLMWISENKFIYNIYSEELNKYQSKIYDTIHRTFKVLDLPIYDCYKDETAYCLNYSRLMDLRPDYGYRNIESDIDYENYENDGVLKLSIFKNTYSVIISLKQLIDLDYLPSMKQAKHKVNHIMVCPDGSKIMFMYRWVSLTGKRYDRLLIANADGGNIKIVCDNEMVSHCTWKNNETIIGYLRYNGEDNFYQINIERNETKYLSEKLKNFGDGHPTIINNKMIFDTYPDRSRMKKLYVYDLDVNKVIFIAEFFESLNFYNQTRCDLHPRFNADSSVIYFDSVHSGKRKLYKIELK